MWPNTHEFTIQKNLFWNQKGWINSHQGGFTLVQSFIPTPFTHLLTPTYLPLGPSHILTSCFPTPLCPWFHSSPFFSSFWSSTLSYCIEWELKVISFFILFLLLCQGAPSFALLFFQVFWLCIRGHPSFKLLFLLLFLAKGWGNWSSELLKFFSIFVAWKQAWLIFFVVGHFYPFFCHSYFVKGGRSLFFFLF